MYILVNNHRIILGLFENKTWLNNAIEVMREKEPDTILYYQYVEVNSFEPILFNFWTMHPEKLIEIPRETKSV